MRTNGQQVLMSMEGKVEKGQRGYTSEEMNDAQEMPALTGRSGQDELDGEKQ